MGEHTKGVSGGRVCRIAKIHIRARCERGVDGWQRRRHLQLGMILILTLMLVLMLVVWILRAVPFGGQIVGGVKSRQTPTHRLDGEGRRSRACERRKW